MPAEMEGMDKMEAGTSVGQDSVLGVRVELVDSEPEIWRLLELRGFLTSSRVHQVLQAAFGWEDAHLHRFVAGDGRTGLLVQTKINSGCSEDQTRNRVSALGVVHPPC